MPDLNLSTVELVTTLRTAALNGSPSSSDYNESQREILVDLAALAGFINNTLLALVNSLPSTALLPVAAPVGIEGRTIWSDTSDQGPIFFDSLSNVPLTLADSLRIINGILSNNSQVLIDLGVEVASLQARLSSTNQNDIALALQNLSAALNSLVVGQTDSTGNISALQIRVTSLETGVATLDDSITTIGNEIPPLTSRVSALEAATVGSNWSNVIVKTTNYNISAADVGSFFINTGAVGEVDFTLPTGIIGLKYSFYIDNPFTVKVIANTGAKIRYLSTLSAANGNIAASTQGNRVYLVCIGISGPDLVPEWIVDTISGNWVVT